MAEPPAKSNDALDTNVGVGAHSAGDHVRTGELMHEHRAGEEYDHDHDELGPLGALEDNAIWIQDHVTLTTVGIDVGSSTTNVIFSQLKLQRFGEDLSSRYVVTSRRPLYQAPMSFTPYEGETRIDQVALGGIIDAAYHAAGLEPASVDAGAVILTGEALRRDNAETIAQVVAAKGGDFVCASAGHHMESMLAAFGSGAVALSQAAGKRVLNIDIGGGTTKLALADRGRVLATAALHIGGRLQVVDERGCITRLEVGGRYWAQRSGFDWRLGAQIDVSQLDAVGQTMADALLSAVRDQTDDAVYLTEPMASLAFDAVMFSGGVGEYIYAREDRDFGDLGRRLGQALRAQLAAGSWPGTLETAAECIRATALGASEYSVQLSGNTIYLSNAAALLPRRNLPVLQPACDLGGDIDPGTVADAIRRHLGLFDLSAQGQDLALAFQWRGPPAYARIRSLARGIACALAPAIARRQPLYLILDGDLAQTLGNILHHELEISSDVLVIDGIVLWDFDFIDLGKIRLPSHTVPVTVKSLIFNKDPRSRHMPVEHRHRHVLAGHGSGHSHGLGHHSHHPGHSHEHD